MKMLLAHARVWILSFSAQRCLDMHFARAARMDLA